MKFDPKLCEDLKRRLRAIKRDNEEERETIGSRDS